MRRGQQIFKTNFTSYSVSNVKKKIGPKKCLFPIFTSQNYCEKNSDVHIKSRTLHFNSKRFWDNMHHIKRNCCAIISYIIFFINYVLFDLFADYSEALLSHKFLSSFVFSAVARKYETFQWRQVKGDWTVVLCALLSGDWLAGLNPNSVFSWDTLLQKASTSMEPSKIQPEGGLNVTLTIRLLMHGKVGATKFQCELCCHNLLSL